MPATGTGYKQAPTSQEIIYEDDSCDNRGSPLEKMTKTQKEKLPRTLPNEQGYRVIRGKPIHLGGLPLVLQGFAAATSLYLEPSGAAEMDGWAKRLGYVLSLGRGSPRTCVNTRF